MINVILVYLTICVNHQFILPFLTTNNYNVKKGKIVGIIKGESGI